MSPQPIRRPANLSLDAELTAEAERLGIDLSRAAEAGIEQAVAKEAARRWKRENAAALASSNAYVEEHGLPLSSFRQF